MVITPSIDYFFFLNMSRSSSESSKRPFFCDELEDGAGTKQSFPLLIVLECTRTLVSVRKHVCSSYSPPVKDWQTIRGV